MRCRTRLMRLFPARESRWRAWLPEEASGGAVPVQEANRPRLANRWTSPTSASSRAAPGGPLPCSCIRVDPHAVPQEPRQTRTVTEREVVQLSAFADKRLSEFARNKPQWKRDAQA